MLNLKNKSNLFLVAFALFASAFFSGFAKADVEIDCSGKEGYALQICEQQKALAEKNHKASQKAQDALEKAQKAADKTQEIKAATSKKNDMTSIENEVMKSKYEEQLIERNNAYSEMMKAIAQGDTETAKNARAKMLDAELAAKASKTSLDATEKAQASAQKTQNKAQKASDKAEKKAIKSAQSAEKKAQKDLNKANKEFSKLQDKCYENPEKCNVEKLQEARAKLEAAKNNMASATQKREDADGTTAAKEQEARRQEELNKVADDFYNQISAVEEDEEVPDVEVNDGKVTFNSDSQGIDSNGNPTATARCASARDNIFHYIACKVMTTLADVRVIVYTLAGFGLIAFAFAAIFNKISWKHLSNLCIALFILSMMTPFINYFTHDNGSGIEYGDYLPAGFTNINGSDMDAAMNCDVSKGDVCPDVNVDTSAKNNQWTWKDLKSSVKTALKAARTGYDMAKTGYNTGKTIVNQSKKIGTAIKHTQGGLTGVLDTIDEVVTASNTIFNATQTGTSAIVSNTASIANDVQNIGKSKKELDFDKDNQNRIKELEKKLSAGNLTTKQQEWAKAELEQRKAAIDSNKVADYANNQGKQALDKLNSVVKVGATASSITQTAANAAQQGATIGGGIGTTGGDVLGSVFGVATAVGEAIGAVDDKKQAAINAANREKEQRSAAEAAAKKQEEIRRNNASYSQGKQWDHAFNATMEQKHPTVQKTASSSDDVKTSSSNTSVAQTSSSNTPAVKNNASANNTSKDSTQQENNANNLPEYIKRADENTSYKGFNSNQVYQNATDALGNYQNPNGNYQNPNGNSQNSSGNSQNSSGSANPAGSENSSDVSAPANKSTTQSTGFLSADKERGAMANKTVTTTQDGDKIIQGNNDSLSSYTLGISANGTLRYQTEDSKGNTVNYTAEKGTYVVDNKDNYRLEASGNIVVIDQKGNNRIEKKNNTWALTTCKRTNCLKYQGSRDMKEILDECNLKCELGAFN